MRYANTTFGDGIEKSFAVGNHLDAQGNYPLYVSYEDYSAGVDNILMTASYDGGAKWSSPIPLNDNGRAVDEFQPNLPVAAHRTYRHELSDSRLTYLSVG